MFTNRFEVESIHLRGIDLFFLFSNLGVINNASRSKLIVHVERMLPRQISLVRVPSSLFRHTSLTKLMTELGEVTYMQPIAVQAAAPKQGSSWSASARASISVSSLRSMR